MYRLTVTVPRITRAKVAELEAQFPGFSTVAIVPVIETEAQAVQVAVVKANKQLATSECISERESVVRTDTGWDIKFRIFGD